MKTKFKETARILFITLAVMLSVTLTQAQPGGQKGGQQGPPPIPNDKQIEKMVTDLSKELSLDEAQQQQVSTLFVAHFNEMKEVQAKYKDSHEAERKDMDNIKTEFDKELKTVLTKEQQKQFDAYREKNKPQGKNEGQRPPKQ